MARPGPKRTPTKILKMRGSWLAGVRDVEPQPGAGDPITPDWLTDPEAVACWRWATEQLRGMGMLHLADQRRLESLCQNYAVWVRCAKAINAMDADTQERARGLAADMFKANDAVRRACDDLGFSPAARADMAKCSEDVNVSIGGARFAIREAE